VTDEIGFYSKDGDHGFLSNFYPCQLVIEGFTFPSAEHAYQWKRAKTPELRNWIRVAPHARYAADAARSLRPYDVAENWMEIRVAWMRRVVWAKFEQNYELAKLLDGTGDAVLVEESPRDEFWGRKPDGTGKNMLGRILIGVRECLRNGPKVEFVRMMPEVPVP